MTTIGLVGTGPSALYTLQALLQARQPLDVALFEAGASAGMGIPYNPATTDKTMLANIASVELPPLGPTLVEWLHTRDDAALQGLGIKRSDINERAFYPRIVLGAYFADGLERMVESAPTMGHTIRVLTRHRVTDVIPRNAAVEIVAEHEGKAIHTQVSHAVIATGHRVPIKSTRDTGVLREAYEATREGALNGRIGILGTSLSAIDVTVAIASRNGTFQRQSDGALSYALHPAAPEFALTMMSRRGTLPEADFYCPIPYLPLAHFTAGAMDQLIEQGSAGLLDQAFALFARELAEADPAYAAAIKLSTRNADDFHTAYYSARTGVDPFIWARQNLREAKANAAAKHTVAWRYAILRAHEVFARAVPHMTAQDARRFSAGLKGVFIDNYAAVPPESIERLLALHQAGLLSVVKIGSDYSMDEGPGSPGSSGRKITIVSADKIWAFDHMIDARGQAALGIDDLPFPSLRLQLKANRLAAMVQTGNDVAVEGSYRLASGLNPVPNVYFLSLPFLLNRNPFVQGLCSAQEMGAIVASHILASLDGASAATIPPDDVAALEALRDTIRTGHQPLFCLDSGLVVLN